MCWSQICYERPWLIFETPRVIYFAINHTAAVDTNCTIVRDLRLLTFHLIRARSAKRNIKCAKLNVYSLRVLCKFASVVKSAFPSERIYLSRAKDPSLDSHMSYWKDWYNVDINVKIRRNVCREINNFREECECRLRSLDACVAGHLDGNLVKCERTLLVSVTKLN